MTLYAKSLRLAVGLATVGVTAAAWSCKDRFIANKEYAEEHENSKEKSLSFKKKNSNIHLPLDKVLASWTTNFHPTLGAEWDHNWDRRDPKSCVKPLKNSSSCSDKERTDHENAIKKATPTATRHLFLIRHGQYVYGDSDEERLLTDLGREQAAYTGTRLNEFGHKYTRLVNSTMTRAEETASIIAKSLSDDIPRESCDLLREGAPIPPEPPSGHYRPEASEVFEEGARLEAAFRRYIHRADPDQKNDSYEIIACHGNVIRFFVCRALQFPPNAWLRFAIYHASITYLQIYPSGYVSLYYYGDAGFMPIQKITHS